ncbi:hypothetical protein [Anaerosporobacter sp.]
MTEETWREIRNYGINTDAFLEAVCNKQKYEKIIEYLDKKIPVCEDKLYEIQETSTKYKTQFNINHRSATGHIMSNYNYYLNIWELDNNNLTNKMETALETAKKRKDEASVKCEHWQNQASREEQALENELSNRKEEERRKEEEQRKAEEEAKKEKEKGSKK